MDERNRKDFHPLQYIRNILTNGLVFLINTVVSFWFTPYLKNNLGVEVYGLIPLATSVTSYLTIITRSFNNSISRYFTIELRNNDDEKANQIFNTAFIGTLFLISIVAPIGIGLVVLSPRIFEIPANQERGVQFLFIGTVFAFLITALDSNFSIATYARNRFDLSNIVNLTSRIGQVTVVFVLFILYRPSLFIVSAGILMASVLTISSDIYLWKRLLPNLKFNFKLFSKPLIKQLFGTSIWFLISQLGSLMFLNTELAVANKTLSLELAGMYGALVTIPSNIRTIGGVVGGIWGPTFLAKYSRKDFSGLAATAKFSIKMIGLAIALPIGFLIGVARPFLTAWLGPEFERMTWVMIVMIVHLAANLSITPLYGIQASYNKVKIPALMTFALGTMNVLVLILFSNLWGPIGIAMGGGLVLSTREMFFTPIYTTRILGLKWWEFYPQIVPNILMMMTTAVLTYLVATFFHASTLYHILFIGGGISIVYLAAVFFLALTATERSIIQNMVIKSRK